MPIVSAFFGIIITMYWREHGRPHFHAKYGEHGATFDIETLDILTGNLPRRARLVVLEWAFEHREELMQNWRLCQEYSTPNPITPLE